MNRKQIPPAVGGASCVEQNTAIFEALKAETEKTAALNRAEQVAKVSDSLNEPTTDKELAELFFSCFSITDEDRDEPIKYTLKTANDVFILPLGDISAVTGLAKSGKSSFVSVLVASLLGCELFGLTQEQERAKVLYIDTEQHRRNVVKLRKRIVSMAGADASERLQIVALRELTYSQRANAVRLATDFFRPSFVVVDGVADLIADFNNIEQSQEIITYLSRLASAYDCHILNVLHTNKGSDAIGVGNMRGHLGAILGNKCAECWAVKKDGQVFTAKLAESRNGGEGEVITYTITENGDLTTADEQIKKQIRAREEAKRQERLTELKAIFKDSTGLTYGDLVARLMSFKEIKDNAAKKRIKTYCDDGYLHKDAQSGLYAILV